MWLAFASTVLLASVQPAKAQEAFECLTEDGPSLLFKLVGRDEVESSLVMTG